jgi:hypothetical protein
MPEEVRFMKIGEMFPSDYIRGIDVVEPVKVKILKVTKETMRSRDGGRAEPAYIIYFEGYPKGVRLNLTMAKEIAVILNDKDLDTDNWSGGVVTLYRTTVKAFGNEHIVVRIRKPEPGDKFLGQQKGKPLNKLNKVEFANRVKSELGLSPDMVGFILKQAGHVTNGKDWPQEKAPAMWDTLQSVGVAFLGFTATVLSDIPYYATEKDVISFLQERGITFEPGEDSETGLYHLLHQHARSVADMDAGEDEQDQPALWREEPESNYSSEEA